MSFTRRVYLKRVSIESAAQPTAVSLTQGLSRLSSSVGLSPSFRCKSFCPA